jgi:hypothetical protein
MQNRGNGQQSSTEGNKRYCITWLHFKPKFLENKIGASHAILGILGHGNLGLTPIQGRRNMKIESTRPFFQDNAHVS